MLHTIIKGNSYQDSVVLMLLTNKLLALDGVVRASVMMGTPANKDILAASGFTSTELDQAGANDMVVVIETDSDAVLETALTTVDDFLSSQANSNASDSQEIARNWEQALKLADTANLALLSIPGIYVADEVDRALDAGLHVFIFSDNVPLEEEVRLKQKAHAKGLLVMGPDCGTGIIGQLPIAFTNVVRRGKIGVVGASGTGIQEVTTIIDRLGSGVSSAIGTGGRDLAAAVGGITMIDAIAALEEDPDTSVILVLSKPPAKEVRERVVSKLKQGKTPAVALFLGEKPDHHLQNLYQAHTLEEAAQLAVALEAGQQPGNNEAEINVIAQNYAADQHRIKGYYSGGTLASEAGILILDALGLGSSLTKKEGYILKTDDVEILDLGDDVYTQGKPHPMIDPEKRLDFIRQGARDPQTAVILLDVVLGYGAHEDMANALAATIKEAIAEAKAQNRTLSFVGSVCGTPQDPQGYESQRQTLIAAGMLVYESNNQAVRAALALLGKKVPSQNKPVRPAESLPAAAPDTDLSQVRELISQQPRVINVGLRSFAANLQDAGAQVLQFDWRPVAGGDPQLRKVLNFLGEYQA